MKDLQPWIDYQAMLEKYVRCGYLEVSPLKSEAYITEAAFCTLFGLFEIDVERDYASDMTSAVRAWEKTCQIVRSIRLYTIIVGTHGDSYKAYAEAVRKLMFSGREATASGTTAVQPGANTGRIKENADKDFALHIVGDSETHELHRTLFISHKRRWWCPWMRREHIEVIPYI